MPRYVLQYHAKRNLEFSRTVLRRSVHHRLPGSTCLNVSECVHVHLQVAEWREEGKAEIVPGVLFIDEVSIQFNFKSKISPAGNTSSLASLCVSDDVL